MKQHGLENLLNQTETNAFLAQIHVERRTPSLDFLRHIMAGTLSTIPFQNLTMLLRPRIAPTTREIKADMLTGLGGLCTTMTPFLCALLHQLGFHVSLLSASMIQPDCHMGIIVDLDGIEYWADIGNGFPYLEPLPLIHQAEAHHPFFKWRLLQQAGEWHVQHQLKHDPVWRTNQRFTVIPRHYAHFSSMRAAHYSQPGYGPFLTGIRINRWHKNGGILMRDRFAWSIPGKKERVNDQTASLWLKNHFVESYALWAQLLSEAWILLEREK